MENNNLVELIIPKCLSVLWKEVSALTDITNPSGYLTVLKTQLTIHREQRNLVIPWQLPRARIDLSYEVAQGHSLLCAGVRISSQGAAF